MTRSVVWFRRDLRLSDNPTLAAAASAGEVVPLFVVDPAFERAGAVRRAFVAGCLRALDESIGGHLVVRAGHPADVVTELAHDVGATTVFAAEDFAPYGPARDGAVSRALAADDRRLTFVDSPYAVEPGEVTKADGQPYAMFTPFRRALARRRLGRSHRGARCRLVPTLPADRTRVPQGASSRRPTPGTRRGRRPQARRALLGRARRPLSRRPQPASNRRHQPPERLSPSRRPHPRQLLARLGEGRGHRAFSSELVWREFYADVLFHQPRSAWENLQPKLDCLPCDTDRRAQERFRAWCEGRTGYPMVDAAMSQLLALGWMHNRACMIAAGFCAKDLHLPWQWGAAHFLRHLVDGDLASNSHGWQWTAGTGTDAAPYIRVFNPVPQGERFDPDAADVRRWVPELADVADRSIHRPSSPASVEARAYPPPIVDHAAERTEALRRFGLVSGRP